MFLPEDKLTVIQGLKMENGVMCMSQLFVAKKAASPLLKKTKQNKITKTSKKYVKIMD